MCLSLTQALVLCCGALTCCCCCCCCFFCCGTCCPPKEDESYKYVDPKDLEAQMRAEDGGKSGWSPAAVFALWGLWGLPMSHSMLGTEFWLRPGWF